MIFGRKINKPSNLQICCNKIRTVASRAVRVTGSLIVSQQNQDGKKKRGSVRTHVQCVLFCHSHLDRLYVWTTNEYLIMKILYIRKGCDWPSFYLCSDIGVCTPSQFSQVTNFYYL